MHAMKRIKTKINVDKLESHEIPSREAIAKKYAFGGLRR
jgi:hypothetical protein